MTRPSVNEVLAYRREIDRRMAAWLASGPSSGHQRYLFELGLHHDQQHQELFLMDLLNLMACSPLDPAAYAVDSHHWLILLGRYVCQARKPRCWECLVAPQCDFQPKTPAP